MLSFKKWMRGGVIAFLLYPSFVLAVVPYQDNNRSAARAVDDFTKCQMVLNNRKGSVKSFV